MRRRLDRDGEVVLATWLDYYQPDKETRHLIAEALDAYGASEDQIRFYAEPDFSNPGEVIITPEEGLGVHVRPLDGQQLSRDAEGGPSGRKRSRDPGQESPSPQCGTDAAREMSVSPANVL